MSNKKRVLLSILGIICVILIWASISGWGVWPILITPEIRGKVTDATTGEPIEKAIITIGFLESVPSVGGGSRSSAGGEVGVTDKEGNYVIPKKRMINILSFFESIRLNIYHPLYLGPFNYGLVIFDRAYPSGKWTWNEVTKGEDGIIHYDMKLMGLGERYLGEEVRSQESEVRSEEEKKEMVRSFWGYLNVHENGWYWLTLKEKNIPFDLEETFKVWNEIVDKYSKYDVVSTEDLNKVKEKIRKRVGDEKP